MPLDGNQRGEHGCKADDWLPDQQRHVLGLTSTVLASAAEGTTRQTGEKGETGETGNNAAAFNKICLGFFAKKSSTTPSPTRPMFPPCLSPVVKHPNQPPARSQNYPFSFSFASCKDSDSTQATHTSSAHALQLADMHREYVEQERAKLVAMFQEAQLDGSVMLTHCPRL